MTAEIDVEDVPAGAGEEVHEGPPRAVPRVAVLPVAVDQDDRAAGLRAGRQTLADHPERVTPGGHEDLLEEGMRLVPVDGLLDGLGAENHVWFRGGSAVVGSLPKGKRLPGDRNVTPGRNAGASGAQLGLPGTGACTSVRWSEVFERSRSGSLTVVLVRLLERVTDAEQALLVTWNSDS